MQWVQPFLCAAAQKKPLTNATSSLVEREAAGMLR
jgi:hypothetical protein